ncbi:MAG: pyridoxal phosphate-dependent aminotransferase [Clostridia bacterium]|jgi:cystathionine beta-lyase|nr:pyridoxal phosphate-dependent aminotransferase [Clostridia bacterium]
MKYDFDEIVDRSENYAAKFQEADLHYGTNNVIPLWIADMDFKTAQPIIDAIHKRADQGIFGYTYRPDEYFEAVRDWQKKRNGYEPDIKKMAFAPGVIPGMRLFINLFSKPGDKIIIQQPVYHPFADVTRNTGRTLVVNKLKCQDGYYTMDYDDFEEKAKQGIKYFILCNPHNPVGRVWTKDELKRVGDICVKYGIEIISDEIHADLMLDGHEHTVMATVSPEIAKITTTCTASSKTFNLAGLQSSTIIFNDEAKKNIYVDELKKMDIARNNCFSLVATMAACRYGEEWLEQLLVYISDNMKFIKEYIDKNIPVLKTRIPEATYLCWVDARGLNMTDKELLRFTVDKAGVAFGMGIDFGEGGSGFLRVNAATSRDTLKKAFEKLKNAIDNI